MIMPKLLRLLACLPLIWLAACSTVPPLPSETQAPSQAPIAHGNLSFSPAAVSALPEWRQQQLGPTLSALRQSCRVVARQAAWATTCQDLGNLNPNDNGALRNFFESRFTAWKLRDGERDSGLITGYYEPGLLGSINQSARTPYPVYGVPSDLVTLSLPPAARARDRLVARRVSAQRLVWLPGVDAPNGGDQVLVRPADFPADGHGALKGRIENGRLLPYYARADIARGMGVSHAQVLALVSDPVELFFLQVQGAGRVQMDDGSIVRLGVGDTNGYGYQSIGRWLADRGEIALSGASMQGLQAWARAHPERQQALFNVNPRYVFFKVQPGGDQGPHGSLGVPLTEGYSIAVDPRVIPLGTPVYLATTWPMSQQSLTRLVSAQDTGNAIRGAIRADFFWGYGDEAGVNAGRMKQSGSMWLLLPNGMQPAI